MIDLNNIEGIYLYSGYTDLRMSISGLSILAQNLYKLDDMKHKLFIFCSKRKDNIKIIELDYDGFWLYQKKLFKGKFIWPKKDNNGFINIDIRQLKWLLEGLNIIQPSAHIESKIRYNF